MKRIQRCFVLTVSLAAALFLLLSFLGRRQERSVFENRKLAAHPQFSLESLWDGSYFEGWDSYLSDHAARRDDLLRDYLWLNLKAKRQVIVNDVVLGKDVLLPYLGQKDPGSTHLEDLARESVSRLEAIRQRVEDQGGRFLYFGIEGMSLVFQEGYPDYLPTHVDYYEASAAAFQTAAEKAGLPTLYLTELLGDRDPKAYYSRVDHHFNLLGAYESYAGICQWAIDRGLELPVVPLEAWEIHPFNGPFYGAYARKLYDLSPVTEPMLVFNPDILPPYARWDNGERTDASLLQLPAEGSPIEYAAYMGGDFGETIIRTHRPELPNLLIVGDSFTNPVEALCAASFNEVRSLDFRYLEDRSLSEYLEGYHADLVVVMRDSLHYLDPEGNGNLN